MQPSHWLTSEDCGATPCKSAQTALRPRGRSYRVVKRLLDLVLSLIALPVLSPCFALIGVLIRLDSPGPAIFRQIRVGKGGKEFSCYKFRSMVHNADQTVYERFLKEVMRGDANSEKGKDQPFRLKIGSDDPRVTQLGRWLRVTSLDELPQLLNVIKGDMSLVGPRPDVPLSVEAYGPFERQRLEVLPGITGLWQVSGRAGLTVRDMFELDARYVEQCSLWMDLKILLRTIPAVITTKGAA